MAESTEMPQESTSTAAKEERFCFHGEGGEFFRIWIVNLVLSIVTLGIYSAWAKVRTKRYFYGNTELAGDRFDYLASPIAILKGRIIAVVLLVIYTVLSVFFVPASYLMLALLLLVMPWPEWMLVMAWMLLVMARMGRSNASTLMRFRR